MPTWAGCCSEPPGAGGTGRRSTGRLSRRTPGRSAGEATARVSTAAMGAMPATTTATRYANPCGRRARSMLTAEAVSSRVFPESPAAGIRPRVPPHSRAAAARHRLLRDGSSRRLTLRRLAPPTRLLALQSQTSAPPQSISAQQPASSPRSRKRR
jgi:hypothetical protein